jgi:hypothetical protein
LQVIQEAKELRVLELKEKRMHGEEMLRLLRALIRVTIKTQSQIIGLTKALALLSNEKDDKFSKRFEIHTAQHTPGDMDWVDDKIVFEALENFEKAEAAVPTPVSEIMRSPPPENIPPPPPVPPTDEATVEDIDEATGYGEDVDDFGDPIAV